MKYIVVLFLCLGLCLAGGLDVSTNNLTSNQFRNFAIFHRNCLTKWRKWSFHSITNAALKDTCPTKPSRKPCTPALSPTTTVPKSISSACRRKSVSKKRMVPWTLNWSENTLLCSWTLPRRWTIWWPNAYFLKAPPKTPPTKPCSVSWTWKRCKKLMVLYALLSYSIVK